MKSQAQAGRDRQTLNRVFPGEWALGLTIVCRHDVPHEHGGKPCRQLGKRVLEAKHPANAAERFRIGLALRDEHLDRIARHRGNVALHLPERIFAIDCDNTAAVELFTREDTPTELRTSASGEQKAHVIWALPPGVRMKGTTKCSIPVGGAVAEFDIRGMTKTVIISAPSHHQDGNDYRWTIPLPENIEDVQIAPPHVMEMLLAGGVNIVEDEDGFAEIREAAAEAPAAAGHDQLLRYVNRWAPRVRSIEVLRQLGEAAVDRIYAGRDTRAIAVREPGGELERIIDSAWEMFGGAAPLDAEQTDQGRALAHRAHFGEIAYWVPPLKKFMRYNGVTWDEVDQVVIEHDFYQLEGVLFDDAQWAEGRDRDALVDASRSLRSARTRTAAAQAMRQQYQADIDTFDADPDLLAFPNGVLNLRTRRFRKQMPEARCTRCMAVPLEADADMGPWQEYLDAVVPDHELQVYLQRLFGMSLLGANKEHVLPFLYGESGTGKSTTLHAVRTAMGTYGYEGSFRSIVRGVRQAGAHTADLFAWRGKRFIALDEIEEGQKLGAVAKSLTGNERIPVAGKHRDEIEIPISWTLVGQGNKEPEADPTDPGLRRRIVEIPFNEVLVKPKGSRDIKWLLTRPNVLAGITRWLVKGCFDYQTEGLGTCAAVEAAKATFWERADALHDWLETACAVGDGLVSKRDDLWHDFDSWQMDNLVPAERLTTRQFNARLKERFGPPRRAGTGNTKWQEVVGVELLSVQGDSLSSMYVPGSTH